MNETLVFTGKLTVTSCWCGIRVGIPDSLYLEARNNGHTVFCPLGHQFVWKTTEFDRMKERLAAANGNAKYYEEQLASERRSKSALKGQLTKARNKIAAGNCPVPDCGQHFSNVREHMKFKHPDYSLTDPETGEAAAL